MNEATKLVDDARRRDDREFFGIRLDASMQRGRFTVTDALSNPRGSFYGGAGVAAAIAMMEAATGRRASWTTLQFLSFASRDDEIECAVDVRSHGKRSSQLRVSAHVDGEEIFTALGATGDPRSNLTKTLERMPSVPAPDDCAVVEGMVPGDVSRSRFAVTEHRLAAANDEQRAGSSQTAFWVRVEGLRSSPALLGYVGDCVALGMFRALGLEIGSATSLDNTLRVGPHVDTDWVLLDLRSHVVADGYGHGTVYQWAPDGTLLGMASQTLVLRPSG